MDYFAQNNHLRNLFDIRREKIDLGDSSSTIFNHPFNSSAYNNIDDFPYQEVKELTELEDKSLFTMDDISIQENNNFNYIIVKSSSNSRAKDVIFLFHGLNERLWQKYLPWAITLHKLTGKAIVLFPIAFHMNRAPSSWSNPRVMKRISNYRISSFA